MKKVIVSLKHTKAGDEYLTLWRGNNSGYTIYLPAAGKYESIEPGYHDSESSLPVEWAKAVDCSVTNNEFNIIIPNDSYTREVLGLKIENNKLVRA